MATKTGPRVVPGNEFLEEIEEIREQVTEGKPLRNRVLPKSPEDMRETRRQRGGTGTSLPKTNTERGLRVPDAKLRRLQLRKTIDEAGQDIFGGTYPAHSELDRIVSRAFGVTDDEMDAVARQDGTPESLVCSGWYASLLRESSWPMGIGTALVSEGEKLNPKRRQWTLDHMEKLRQLYEEWEIEHVDRATLRDDVHAEVDVEHSNLDADTIREYVNTAELQDEFRRDWILRIQEIQTWRL